MRNLCGDKRGKVRDSERAWSSGNRGLMVIFTPAVRYDVPRHSAISIEYASDFGCIPESAINFQSIIGSLSDAKSSAKDIIVLSVLSGKLLRDAFFLLAFRFSEVCQPRFGKREHALARIDTFGNFIKSAVKYG